MEVQMKLNDNWQIEDATFENDYDLLENQTANITVLHLPTEWNFTIRLKITELLANQLSFQFAGPAPRPRKIFKQFKEDFAIEHAGTIRGICLMLVKTYSFTSMKEIMKKAAYWDQLAKLSGSTPKLPSFDEACRREDQGIGTALDSFIINYSNGFSNEKVYKRFCDELRSVLAWAATRPMPASGPNADRNSHIKIFEFQLPNGVLKWVAAESAWKAALWFMDQYDIFCMEDEILDIVELPRDNWSEYFLFEEDGRQVSFDTIIRRRKSFPQTIAITGKDGKCSTDSTVENTPLGYPQPNISSSKNRSHATA